MAAIGRKRQRAIPKNREKWRPVRLKAGRPLPMHRMPQFSRNVFKRMSEIYGIPMAEMAPLYLGWFPSLRYGGINYRNSGSIFGQPGRELLEHELGHSASDLLERENYAEKTATRKKQAKLIGTLRDKTDSKKTAIGIAMDFGEPIAENNKNALRKHRFGEKIAVASSEAGVPYWQQAMLGMMWAMSSVMLRSPALRSYIPSLALSRTLRRHGEDGFILLVANPPKNYSTRNLLGWEYKMVKRGYLERKGGLTKKGIQLVRELSPREVILDRLKRQKEVQAAIVERMKAERTRKAAK
ncbi:MAG: hypothetical protein NT067_03135 [Candidatus Diapherotrites archaeon]|nr:hypothetical protein [Candidatus Diapherotrites archaeon]